MKKRKEFWKLGRSKKFKKSFEKLIPQDKWHVEHAINKLLSDKTPEKHYPTTQCSNCGMDDIYLAAVAHDGFGNMGVELEFKVNRTKMVITPIFTRRTRLFNSRQSLNR